MISLYFCRACGFHSSLSSNFEAIDGVLFDKGCAENYRSKKEPIATWVAEAIKEVTP